MVSSTAFRCAGCAIDVSPKAIVEDPYDIAHIYGSLHCNHFSLHSKVLDCETTCITSSSFAGNDELVAVEDSIDVGNVLWIFYDCLYGKPNVTILYSGYTI